MNKPDKVSRDCSAFLTAVSKMRSPHQMGIICIDITNKCDLGCSNCTRLLENQDKYWDMTPENFRQAVRSLADFPGVIAVIGGNPPMHRNFADLCKIFSEEFPDKKRRGLWSNNIFKHTDVIKETFGFFNLNPHGMKRGIDSVKPLTELTGTPNVTVQYHEGNSTHSPLLTAIADLMDEEEMWDAVSKCDVNQQWSAAIVQNQGNLRAYFCEVAASFDLARGTDNGIEVTPGWWRRTIASDVDFLHQVRTFCPGCGVPARLKGHLDADETDTYTARNADLAQKSAVKGRKIVEVRRDTATRNTTERKVTDYASRFDQKSAQPSSSAQAPRLIGDTARTKRSELDLWSLYDEDFVRAAYRTVLGRDVDPDGFNHYTNALRNGYGRIEIVCDLAKSEEGSRRRDAFPPAVKEVVQLSRSWTGPNPFGLFDYRNSMKREMAELRLTLRGIARGMEYGGVDGTALIEAVRDRSAVVESDLAALKNRMNWDARKQSSRT